MADQLVPLICSNRPQSARPVDTAKEPVVSVQSCRGAGASRPFLHSTDFIPCASSVEVSVDPVSCRRSELAASGSFACVLRAAPIVT
jgi:hypothetical protein